MAMRLPDYLRKPHKQSTKKGWTWEHKTGSKHVAVHDASGAFVVTISLTAFDGPLTKKVKSQLRNAGCPGVAR